MRSSSLAICLLVLTSVQLRVAWLRLVGPAPLGPPLPARTAYATERVGDGLVCTADRVRARSRMCREGPCGELSTQRRLLLGAPLDPWHMSLRDWEALPHVGPARARALSAAFAPGQGGHTPAGKALGGITQAGIAGIAHIRGFGARLSANVTAQLDAEARSDICSVGSWPTTSSGYDRLR